MLIYFLLDLHRVGNLFAVAYGHLFDKFLWVHVVLELHLLHFVAVFHRLWLLYFWGRDCCCGHGLLDFQVLIWLDFELTLGLLGGLPLGQHLWLDGHR